MKPSVAIQAWLPGVGEQGDRSIPSGARNRLLGLVDGLRHVARSADWKIRLLTSRDQASDRELGAAVARLEDARIIQTEIPSTPTWKRVLGERRVLPSLVREFDLLEMASLPLVDVPVPCNLLIHDLRDLGAYARGLMGARRAVAARGLRSALRRAQCIVVPTSAVRDEVVQRTSTSVERIRVVPPGIEVPPEESWPRLDRFPARAFVSLARPEPRKDLPFVLRAFAAARERDTSLPDLVFAGAADRAWGRIVKLADQLGVRGGVHFVHDLRDDERWPLLAGASALLFPSRLEGFGLPALEAALVGCPVLLRHGGVPHDILGETAVAIRTAREAGDDIAAWSDAILSTAQSALAARRARADTRVFARRYAPARAAERWLASWEAALTRAEDQASA